jgi:hypothetical protein
MMTFKEILEKAGEIPESTYIKYLQQYKPKGNTIHFFFEGQSDLSFYANYIENIYPNDYKLYFYLCDGKENVEQNYNDINWDIYSKNRTLFFIDKDFDDILNIRKITDENIFETQYYSVENYFVTSQCYIRFLKEICNIKIDQIIKDLALQFDRQLDAFHTNLKLMTAWIIYCRKNNYKINLNDIHMAKIFTITNELELKRLISKSYKSFFQYLFDATKCSQFDSKEVFEIARELMDMPNPKMYIRGKYEFWFMFNFYKTTIDHLIPFLNQEIKNKNKKSGTKLPKYKVHIELKETNICDIIASRVRIPDELNQFLTYNLKRAI